MTISVTNQTAVPFVVDPLEPQYGSEASSRPAKSAYQPGSFKLKPEFHDYFSYIDNKEETYVYRLRDAVAIQSVSAEPAKRPEVMRMIDWTKRWIEKLGGTARLHENPGHEHAGPVQKLDDGSTIPLPPILLGQFGNDPSKKTVCVYGHLDVQPASKEDGWDTEPFELTEIDGKLFGRGATDDKGPALSWLWMVEAFNDLKMPLPVNIKIIYEGMEEYGSEGMFEAVNDLAKQGENGQKRNLILVHRPLSIVHCPSSDPFLARFAHVAGKFLDDVDFFCISDNYWLGKNKPCLTYGLRGMAYFEVGVECSKQDLHSGVYGGTVHEAMTDLVRLMGSLVDTDGKVRTGEE